MKEKIKFGTIWYLDDPAPVFHLEHQCDEWVIGKLDEAKAFHEELGNKIKEVEAVAESEANEQAITKP